MADAGVTLEAAEAPAKPSLVKRLLLPVLMLIVGLGGGAAAGWFAPQFLPQAEAEDPTRPKMKMPKPGPLEYVPIDNSFTANLKDSGRFVQVKIAISTHGGPPVVEELERHKIAIIAAVLAVLADTTEERLQAPGGRDALTRDMRIAINDLLQRKSGIAGVDEVFLTSFVLQ